MYFHESDNPSDQTTPARCAGPHLLGREDAAVAGGSAPHAVIPPHSHPHEQIGMCLEGEFPFTIGDETRTVKPGDVWVIPGGVEHSVAMGDMPGLVVEMFSPVREEYKY